MIKATFRVSGEKSKEVEDFLVKNYGLTELNWACCGWDSPGYGSFENPKLTEIIPDCSVLISMYGSGEVRDKNDQSVIRLEKNRNKIEYFTVIVTIAII